MICTYLANMCVFPTQRRLLCLLKTYFPEQDHIIFVGLFTKIFNTLPCYLKYDWNIWLYSTLTEADFNGTFVFITITWLGKTHRSVNTFCIPSVVKSNHNRGWHLVHWLWTISGERTILASWVVWIKGIKHVSKNHVVKILVKALTSYYTFLKLLHLFLAVFILSEVVALNKLGQPIILWLVNYGFII